MPGMENTSMKKKGRRPLTVCRSLMALAVLAMLIEFMSPNYLDNLLIPTGTALFIRYLLP